MLYWQLNFVGNIYMPLSVLGDPPFHISISYHNFCCNIQTLSCAATITRTLPWISSKEALLKSSCCAGYEQMVEDVGRAVQEEWIGTGQLTVTLVLEKTAKL